MAKILPVVLHPHPVLLAKAQPVAAVDDAVRQILDNMLVTLYSADGVGLAANQVNILKRLVVIDIGSEDKEGKRDYAAKKPMKLVNPEIVKASEERIIWTEACLSIPPISAEVERAAKVTVKYLNEEGQSKQLDAEGLLAVCLQHEIDHLDGVLFPQRLSKVKRDMAWKKYAKQRDEWLESNPYDVLTDHGAVAAHKKM